MAAAILNCEVMWANQLLHLLPEHALWWPAEKTLFVADVHLGKAASYRALGQPVPSGSTQQNLARLQKLIFQYTPKQLVFLGDFLHAPQAHTPAILKTLQTWRTQHKSLEITLVRGNHDNRAGDPPEILNIKLVNEPWLLGPFACCHHPQSHPTHFVLAGHKHPSYTLYGPGRDSLCMPCFVKEDRHAILPAFGEFTGGMLLSGAAGRQLYAVGGGRVWCLPPHQ